MAALGSAAGCLLLDLVARKGKARPGVYEAEGWSGLLRIRASFTFVLRFSVWSEVVACWVIGT